MPSKIYDNRPRAQYGVPWLTQMEKDTNDDFAFRGPYCRACAIAERDFLRSKGFKAGGPILHNSRSTEPCLGVYLAGPKAVCKSFIILNGEVVAHA